MGQHNIEAHDTDILPDSKHCAGCWYEATAEAEAKCAAEHYTREEVREMIVRAIIETWQVALDTDDVEDFHATAVERADRILAEEPHEG